MDPWTIFMPTHHLGSTTMVTYPTGAVSQKVLSSPYGQTWTQAGGVLTWRFASLREGLPVDSG